VHKILANGKLDIARGKGFLGTLDRLACVNGVAALSELHAEDPFIS